jgi:hypothetical protein
MVNILSDIVRNLKKACNFCQLYLFYTCHNCGQYHTYIIACGFNFEDLCLIDEKEIFSNFLLIFSVLFRYFDGLICR